MSHKLSITPAPSNPASSDAGMTSVVNQNPIELLLD